MKKDNVILDKTFAFAVRIVRLEQYLRKRKVPINLSTQILKSGTSIGANMEEAIGARSKAEFISCIGISYREARETNYWLKLLHECGYIPERLFESFKKDCEEILRIITSIQKSAKAKKNSN